MITLGINAYHGDASAAIFVDGELIAAVEEERFTRQKHQAGFPAASVRWCLDEIGASIHDVAHAAISRDPFAHLPKKIAWTLQPSPDALVADGAGQEHRHRSSTPAPRWPRRRA